MGREGPRAYPWQTEKGCRADQMGRTRYKECMSSLRATALLLALVAAAPCISGQTADAASGADAIALPEPTASDLAGWRACVLPLGDELGFDSLAWSADLATGLERSAAEQKPLLLWLMNGHPLGCT